MNMQAQPIRDGKDRSDQHQRKQTRYNKLATFDFFDKRRTGEEESERN